MCRRLFAVGGSQPGRRLQRSGLLEQPAKRDREQNSAYFFSTDPVTDAEREAFAPQ
jgi:hypothetical protein